MSRYVALTLGLALCANAVLAAPSLQDKKAALRIAQAHIKTIHCPLDEQGAAPDNVYALDEDTFFVLSAVDYGCSGGSATSGYVLTRVLKTPTHSGDQFLVARSDVFEKIKDQDFNPRFVSVPNLKGSPAINPKTGQLTLISYSLDADDAPNFPSRKFQFILDLVNEKLVGKKYLGKESN